MPSPVSINTSKVKEARNAKGFTQEDLAHEARCSLRTIQHMESQGTPSHYTLKHVAAALGLKPSDLIGSALPDVETDDNGERFWNVPIEENPFFTGRSDVLNDLREELNRFGRQVLRGLGGVGKTQTAAQYAFRHRSQYQSVFWIRCDAPASIQSSVENIAERLGIRRKRFDAEKTRIAFHEWLKANSVSLLIFDNADELDAELIASLRRYLPDREAVHVLITSRARKFDSLGFSRPFHLKSLSNSDASSFLMNRAGRFQSDDAELRAADDLATALGGLPLALEQAGAYLCAVPISFSHYLHTFEKQHIAILEQQKPVTGDYDATVATTWLLNFSKVKAASAAAADLLRISSFMDPDEIPFELVIDASREMGPSLTAAIAEAPDRTIAFSKVLSHLERYSLVDVTPGNHTYSMHRMVQLVLRRYDDT